MDQGSRLFRNVVMKTACTLDRCWRVGNQAAYAQFGVLRNRTSTVISLLPRTIFNHRFYFKSFKSLVKIFHLSLSIPINSLWEALEMKARSPEKSMNVRDVQVSDEDSYLSRNMTIRAILDTQFPVSPANNKIVKERSWINPITSKIETQPLDTDTDAELHDERIICSSRGTQFARGTPAGCHRWN